LRALRLLAGLAVIELIAGTAGAVALRSDAGHGHPPPAIRGRIGPSAAVDAARTAGVRAVLAARAAAVHHRDRAAWLATVDPSMRGFHARQRELFDALGAVPLSDWTYHVDPDSGSPDRPDLDAVHGAGWWAPQVTLTYRIAGYDETPTVELQRLTFVPRAGRWLVAADDDLAADGKDTARGIWDAGPVTVVRGRSCIVLGHPGSRSLMRRVALSVDAAVPRVTSIWGSAWSRKVVVLVPSSQQELTRIVGGTADYSQIAAVATAELSSGLLGATGYHPVGDRVVVNPTNFLRLGSLGRRVVLTHEVTHVATRAATGPAAPAWLVEGLADYIGYLGVGVPYSVSAQELHDAVRQGHLPVALPSERDFDGGNQDLAQVYEQAWTAVSLIAETYGRSELLRFYRAVGRAEPSSTAVDQAFTSVLGTDVASFTAAWRLDLPRRLR
jgi:hypothetical protein